MTKQPCLGYIWDKTGNMMRVQLCSHVIWGYDSWQCHIRSLYFYLFVYFSWQEVGMSVSRALKMEMCFLRRADSSSPSSIPESSEIKLFWWILTFNFLPSGKITSLPLLNFALKFFTVVNSSAAQIWEERNFSGDLRWPAQVTSVFTEIRKLICLGIITFHTADMAFTITDRKSPCPRANRAWMYYKTFDCAS